jgi:predicted RNA binding protein YcfA (HicA-like mRNA interferase family)
MNDYAKEVRRLLLAAGCHFVRSGKGSHETWANPATGAQFTVPLSIKVRHTANGILKDAGLGKGF